jgi:uncharacterized protein YjdB
MAYATEVKYAVPTVSGLTHQANRGDVPFSGSLFAGTKGEGRNIEGFSLQLNGAPAGLNIEYMCHQAGVGDLPWASNGAYIGSRGQGRHIEGITCRLTGPGAHHFILKYVVHMAGKGDSPIAFGGAYAGTKGEGRAIEGIHVWLEAAPMPTVNTMVHAAGKGDITTSGSLFTGTKGEGRQIEGFSVSFSGIDDGLGVEYMAHQAEVGDLPWAPKGTFIGSRGQGRRIEGIAIRLTGPRSAEFNINYVVHMAGKGDSPVVQNGGYCGTKGEGRAIEGIHVWLARK